MKKILLPLLIVFIINHAHSQENIFKKNDDKIKTIIGNCFNESDILAENNIADELAINTNCTDNITVINQNDGFGKIKLSEQEDQKYRRSRRKKYDGKYFMLAAGYGTSYAGYGIRAQWRMGAIQGFGVHLGAGYFPSSSVSFPILGAVGVKFFPYKAFYIDAMLGHTGYEIKFETGTFGFTEETKKLYGTSLMVGGDFNWGKNMGYGFNIGIGLSYNLNNNEYIDPVIPAGDIGFVVRF